MVARSLTPRASLSLISDARFHSRELDGGCLTRVTGKGPRERQVVDACELSADAGEVAATDGAGEVTIPKSELSLSANVLVPEVVYSARVG